MKTHDYHKKKTLLLSLALMFCKNWRSEDIYEHTRALNSQPSLLALQWKALEVKMSRRQRVGLTLLVFSSL